MRRARTPLAFLVLALACGGPRGTPLALPGDARIVDLTHAFGPETIYWPTEAGFRFEKQQAAAGPDGWYAANVFVAPEHGGTHLDAPYHFAERGQTADQVPLARLVGEAIVIDVAAACVADPDHAISAADVTAHEARVGTIPRGAIALLRTGWSARWPDRATYLGTAARGPDAVAALRFPGLGADAARLLVERGVSAVGIDTASIDPGRSQHFESHRVLAAAQVPIFENLRALESLPARGALIVALPMPIAGGTGGPLRAVAFLPGGR